MANYISNKDFTLAVSEYREKCLEADALGKERPVIPRDIAESFIMIARKLANRPNFFNYTYKEEMISEALITCCSKICNFNPEITQNAFAYFTQLCWYDFIAYIMYEKNEAYVKAKSYFNAIEEYGNVFKCQDDEHDISSDFIPYFDVEEFERKDKERRDKNKKKKEIGPLDELMEEGNEDE